MGNIAICLIHQANYLFDQQLNRLEKDFLKDGGLLERMTRARDQQKNGRGRDPRITKSETETNRAKEFCLYAFFEGGLATVCSEFFCQF